MPCTFIRCYYRVDSQYQDDKYKDEAIWIQPSTNETRWESYNPDDINQQTLWVSESFENQMLEWKKMEGAPSKPYWDRWEPHFGDDFSPMWKMLDTNYNLIIKTFVAHYQAKEKNEGEKCENMYKQETSFGV